MKRGKTDLKMYWNDKKNIYMHTRTKAQQLNSYSDN